MYQRIDGYSLFQNDLDHIADHLAPLAGKLKGARLLITGGTGFFGIWLLEGLVYADDRLSLGLDITVMSRDPERFLNGTGRGLRGRKQLRWLKNSVLDFPETIGPFSHILHAASESNPDGASDWAYRHMRSTIDGTQRLIDLTTRQKVEALLLTTSGAVYGNPDRMVDQRFVEGMAGNADFASEKNVYGQSKRTVEMMASVTASHAGFRALIARCFAFVGPYLSLDANYAIGNFMRDAMAGKPIIVSGDGTPLRSYLYAADLVIWLMTILANGQSGRPYNVGGEASYSIGDLAHLVNRVAGGHSDVQIKGIPVPGAVPHAYLPNIDRARADLGLVPAIGLEEGIRRTIAWHKSRQA